MADIFTRASDAFGGSFSADAAQVTFAQRGFLSETSSVKGGGDVGMLVQQLQFTYQQQVTRVYEIGTQLTFYVAGRTSGQLSMGRVLGPRPVALAFYQKYGDVCEAATNNLDIQLAAGCSFPGEFRSVNAQLYAFTMKYVVITSIGVSMTAQDMMINEQLMAMFSSLNLNQVTSPVIPKPAMPIFQNPL